MNLRRTMLFIPGNNPGMLQNGGVFGADVVILDLEDAVAPTEKDTARLLVSNALNSIDYGTSEKVVRINPLETFAYEDICAIIPCQPDALLVPKIQSANDVKEVAELITKLIRPGQKPVNIVALLETPKGIAEAYNIAQAHPNLVAIALGAEDYTAAIGAKRTIEGMEIFTARNIVINAAATAGIQSIDTPFTDANDDQGLQRDTELAKQLGFKGKLAINPRQLKTIHNVFDPTVSEIKWAKRVTKAIMKAESEGSGVASLDGKMVDAPIVNRAERIIFLAQLLKKVESDAL